MSEKRRASGSRPKSDRTGVDVSRVPDPDDDVDASDRFDPTTFVTSAADVLWDALVAPVFVASVENMPSGSFCVTGVRVLPTRPEVVLGL